MKKIAMTLIFWSSLTVFAEEPATVSTDLGATCAACHGPKGVSSTPIWPNLAGQNEKYLMKQLIEMQQAKTRNVPTMTAMISSLSKKQLEELAAYYAKLPKAEGITPQKYLKRGEQLYRGGDFNQQITACIACHGPKGTGNSQAGFPVLSGQKAAYTVLQLQNFKTGKRTNDLNHIMQDISKRMSDADMEAVAHYIEGLY